MIIKRWSVDELLNAIDIGNNLDYHRYSEIIFIEIKFILEELHEAMRIRLFDAFGELGSYIT